jgi:hypothetical protein
MAGERTVSAPRKGLVGGSHRVAAEAKSDPSSYALVAANVFAAAVAAATGMTLRELAIVYWVQSIVIGLSFFVRILSLEKYSATRELPDGSPTPLSQRDKHAAAITLLIGYGALHVVYSFFLFAGDPGVSRLWVVLCALAFLVSHAYSLAHNINLDRRDNLHLGTLVSIPYVRILPMMLVIATGAFFFGHASLVGLIVFTVIKTVADVIAHVIEHHELREGASLRWLREGQFEREAGLRVLRERERP